MRTYVCSPLCAGAKTSNLLRAMSGPKPYIEVQSGQGGERSNQIIPIPYFIFQTFPIHLKEITAFRHLIQSHECHMKRTNCPFHGHMRI